MRISKKELLFYLSYIFLYLALFLGDIGLSSAIHSIARVLRLSAYALIAVRIIFINFKSKDFITFIAILALTLIYGIFTRDLYWSILTLYINNAKEINQEKIIRISFNILMICTVCVVLLCFAGVIPDVMTIRDTFTENVGHRHSFGFYHSNVLPLIILYLESYYIMMKREKVRVYEVMIFTVFSSVTYYFCDSRNAFYLTLILSFLVIVFKSMYYNKRIESTIYYAAKYSVVGMSLFSYAMMFLLLRGGIWDKVDGFFSGRFRLSIFKMRRIGLHLVNFMSNEDFFEDSILYVNGSILDTVVLDNGYIYIILRYGILLILFYFVISFILAQKSKNNIFCLTTILVIFIANFVDNDLVDYSFLPFILYAFARFSLESGRNYNSMPIKMTHKKRKRIRI
jgi:hypothetical protein|nr:hypothetical protein [uncultured Acetatifactor sp.]